MQRAGCLAAWMTQVKANDPDYTVYEQPYVPDFGIDTNIFVDPLSSSTSESFSTTTASSLIPVNNQQTTTELPATPTVTSPRLLETTTLPPVVSDSEISDMVQYFWDVTSHRQFLINRDYMLSFQGHTNASVMSDQAPKKLFARVKGDIRGSSQIAKHFMRLLKSYSARWSGSGDTDNSLEVAKFLQYASRSEAFLELEQFLTSKGLLDTVSFPELMESAWFQDQPDTPQPANGFQRVFVGSQTSSELEASTGGTPFVGLNNWIQFYLLEKEKTLNYQGYISKQEPGLVRVRYSLSFLPSPALSSFFVGTPPDFEMAVYSLCLVVRTNQDCQFTLQGHDDVTVVVKATPGDNGHLVIMDAHPVL